MPAGVSTPKTRGKPPGKFPKNARRRTRRGGPCPSPARSPARRRSTRSSNSRAASRSSPKRAGRGLDAERNGGGLRRSGGHGNSRKDTGTCVHAVSRIRRLFSRNTPLLVRFRRGAPDRRKRGDGRPGERMGTDTARQAKAQRRRDGRFSAAGNGFCLDYASRAVPYSPGAAREFFPPGRRRNDRTGFFTCQHCISLSQATSSPKLPQSFDGTEPHARDAPRRVLSRVLFRGVVTPGLDMKERRAFFCCINPATQDGKTRKRNPTWTRRTRTNRTTPAPKAA